MSARVPSVFSLAILIPLQKLPKSIQGTPASSTMILGSIAFQSSLVVPMFEQRTFPLSVQVPLSSAARVAWPMHDLLLAERRDRVIEVEHAAEIRNVRRPCAAVRTPARRPRRPGGEVRG